MKADVKQDWLTALRDPNAKQTKFALETENGNCCLGVLTNVIIDKYPEIGVVNRYRANNIDTPTSAFIHKKTGQGFCASMPYYLLEDIGLTITHRTILVCMNDAEDKTFAEIANYIEEVIPGE